jgi:hypothetical protein
MMWDAEVEHSIVQTMATDADSGVEGTISYSIVKKKIKKTCVYC